MRGEDVDDGLDDAAVDARPGHGDAACLHVLLFAAEGGLELRLEEEEQGVAGGGENLGAGLWVCGVSADAVSANELDEGVAAAGLVDGVVRVVPAQLAVLCEDARAFELDAGVELVQLHHCDDNLEELQDAGGPHPVAHEVREQGEGEAHVLEADAGLWGVAKVHGGRVALELERGGVGYEVDAGERDLGLDLDMVCVHTVLHVLFIHNVLRVFEQDLEASHGVLDGALLHGDLLLGLPCPGPHDEAEGVGEPLDLLGHEVLGGAAGVGEGLCGALDEEREAVLVL